MIFRLKDPPKGKDKVQMIQWFFYFLFQILHFHLQYHEAKISQAKGAEYLFLAVISHERSQSWHLPWPPECCINPYEKKILKFCIQTEMQISPWSQWDFRLCSQSWLWKKCFCTSPKQWVDRFCRHIELDRHIKTIGKWRREKDPQICRHWVILASGGQNLLRLQGVASKLTGFKFFSSHIHTKQFTALFSFAISQHTENSIFLKWQTMLNNI